MAAVPHSVDEAKILVIYTGGTIGMMLGPSGYRPEASFLVQSLRRQARFHDPLEQSIYSHASSLEGFREWTDRGSPAVEPVPPPPPPPAKTLRVRSSRPIGTLAGPGPSTLGETPSIDWHPTCRQVANDVYEADLPSLVTPKSTVHGLASKRIRYAILEVTCRISFRSSRDLMTPTVESSLG
jgi:60kDa lysophospholipase